MGGGYDILSVNTPLRKEDDEEYDDDLSSLICSFRMYRSEKAGKGKTQELTTMENQKEIYLAGGCFWGTEHFMKQIRGVEATQVGYANSTVADPDYPYQIGRAHV